MGKPITINCDNPRTMMLAQSLTPSGPPRVIVRRPHLQLLWLAPKEWLCISDELSDAEIITDMADEEFYWVDVTDNRVRFHFSGPAMYEVLSAGCSLDLENFPVNEVAQTMIACAHVILYREDEGFTVLVRRSFAHYFSAWIADVVDGILQERKL